MLWLDNFTSDELEEMMHFFLFDTICLNNFNKYNRRVDLHFYHNTAKNPNGITVITIYVENKNGYPIKLSN